MFHEELDAYLGNNRRDRLYGKSLVKDLMLNEYCPELGRIMEELVSGGLAERLLVMSPVRDSEREIAEFLVFAEEAKEELGKKENFRQDLVDYAIDSVSYALGFLNKVRVPPEAEDDPFDDLEKDYVPYEEQDKYYSVGSMLDIIYEFDDFLDELMLGRAYEYGDGIRQSYPRAMKWFRRSADYGIAEAMVEIGNMYCCGTGVREDPAGAESWYRKAAERHKDWSDLAEACLKDMLRRGEITDLTGEDKVKWLIDADARGNPSAARQLGDMYASGDGIAEDLPEALRWYRKVADDGDPKAMIPLGLMYKNGTGTGLDYEEALRWLRKAAESPFELAARYHLGTMYREGKGVPRDPGEAVRLFLSAVAFGCPEADSRSGRCMRGARESPRTPARPCSITGMPRGGAPLRRCSALAKCTGTAGALSRTSGGPGSSLMTRLSSGTKEPRRPFRGCREKTAGPGRRSETAGNARYGSAAGSQNEL